MRSCSIKRQQRAPANTITLPSVGNNCRSSRKLGTSPKIIKYSFVCCFVFFYFLLSVQPGLSHFVLNSHLSNYTYENVSHKFKNNLKAVKNK